MLKDKSWVCVVSLISHQLRCYISYIDSKIQAQLYNLNPDNIGNLCMHLDSLGLCMLYPTSSNLGSLFFFLTQYVSLLIFQWFANVPPKSSSLIPYHKTFQILELTPIQNMAYYWNCRLQCVSCLSLHWAGLQTSARAVFLSDSAFLWQTVSSKELTIWKLLLADGSVTSWTYHMIKTWNQLLPSKVLKQHSVSVLAEWVSWLKTQFDFDSHLRTQKSFLVQTQPKNLQKILWWGPPSTTKRR